MLPHFPQTRLKAVLYIGQDQISVGKKPSATLLLNMGIICACEWLSPPPSASHFLQEVRVYDKCFNFTMCSLGQSTGPPRNYVASHYTMAFWSKKFEDKG
jgi:hypothetical protein